MAGAARLTFRRLSLTVCMQGMQGTGHQGGLVGLDAPGSGRSILWDPQDPLLGTPDMVPLHLFTGMHFTGKQVSNMHALPATVFAAQACLCQIVAFVTVFWDLINSHHILHSVSVAMDCAYHA